VREGGLIGIERRGSGVHHGGPRQTGGVVGRGRARRKGGTRGISSAGWSRVERREIQLDGCCISLNKEQEAETAVIAVKMQTTGEEERRRRQEELRFRRQ
jgi:hypothetical protein